MTNRRLRLGLIYAGIVCCILSIFFVLGAFHAQHNVKVLFPIVLPIMLLGILLANLKRAKNQ
jgi:hypothetical protein